MAQSQKKRPGPRWQVVFGLFLALSLLLSGCSRHEFGGLLLDDPQEAEEIQGTNWDGSPFHLSDLRGKVVVLFFGYTFCPDICPIALTNMKAAYKQLGEPKEDVAVVFVSVDPDRDTPERLAQYVPAFNPDFYGVHAPQDALDVVKAAYGVYAEKRYLTDDESSADYFVDHTGGVYIIDREGRLRELLQHDTDPEILAGDLRYFMDK